MTLTWSASAKTQSFSARSRAITFLLAVSLCALLVYLALTQRFSAIAEMFIDTGTPITIVEPPAPPPAPPPIVEQRPPDVQRQTPTNIDAPQTPTFDPIIETPADPGPPAPVYINANFLERPSGPDFERFFPRRALERAVSGRVLLDCTVAANGRLACAVASETPAGWGFGEASLRAAQQFRVAPATADGRPTSGGRLQVPMTWRVR